VVYCTNRVNPNSLADQRTFMSARIHVSTIHHYILNPYGTLKDEISPPHHNYPLPFGEYAIFRGDFHAAKSSIQSAKGVIPNDHDTPVSVVTRKGPACV
jgi:hypothetical protein